MHKVLIMGAYGFLGNALSEYLREQNIIVFRQGRNSNSEYVCNPNSRFELENLINKLEPNTVINLIADTDVERCELNFVNSFQINCDFREYSIFLKK